MSDGVPIDCSNYIPPKVTPYTLGVEIEGKNIDSLIPANTPVPVTVCRTYVTLVHNATALALNIYKGEQSTVDGNELVIRLEAKGITRAPFPYPIEVTFNVDENYNITVTARDRAAGIELTIVQLRQEPSTTTKKPNTKIKPLVLGNFMSDGVPTESTNLIQPKVTPSTLGMEVKGKNIDILIPANTPVPVTVCRTYVTLVHNATKLVMKIYKGEQSTVDGNELVMKLEAKGITPALFPYPIEVFLNVDENYNIRVTARDRTAGKELTIVQLR